MAGERGFEPRLEASKTSVLPLHHSPIKKLYIYIITQPLFYRAKKMNSTRLFRARLPVEKHQYDYTDSCFTNN